MAVAADNATYVKVWVGKVHWAGENGAVVCLQQVYGGGSELPSSLLLPLQAAEADEFQKALFGRLSPSTGGDDALCDVRVHGGSPEPFAELVMNVEGCPFPLDDAPDGRRFSLSDVLGMHEQRHRCGVGEALGTSQRLEVPALVCTSHLLGAAKACLGRVMLERAVQRSPVDQALGRRAAVDPELRALEEQLSRCLAHGPAAGAGAVGGALRAASAFAWYWALNQEGAGQGSEQSFREFYIRYLRLAGQGEGLPPAVC